MGTYLHFWVNNIPTEQEKVWGKDFCSTYKINLLHKINVKVGGMLDAFTLNGSHLCYVTEVTLLAALGLSLVNTVACTTC